MSGWGQRRAKCRQIRGMQDISDDEQAAADARFALEEADRLQEAADRAAKAASQKRQEADHLSRCALTRDDSG